MGCTVHAFNISPFVLSCYLVAVNFVVLCETYSKQKKKLTKAEHKEILEYARDRYICMYCILLTYLIYISTFLMNCLMEFANLSNLRRA